MYKTLQVVPPPQQYLESVTRGLQGLGGPGLATTALAGTLAGALGQMELSPTARNVVYLLGTVGFVASVYHGVKRFPNQFWRPAFWGLFGAVLPFIAVPVALAQGFAKRKGR